MELAVAQLDTATARDFDSIVGPWLEPGFRLAVTMLRNPDEARDAVQEAAVKAWRSLDRLRDVDQARSWFLAIVANECRSTMRRPWWNFHTFESRPTPLANPEDSAVRSLDLDRAMERLSPNDRALLHLHFFLDLPLEEIGRVLHISSGAARTRVYRAAHRLRPGLSEEEMA